MAGRAGAWPEPPGRFPLQPAPRVLLVDASVPAKFPDHIRTTGGKSAPTESLDRESSVRPNLREWLRLPRVSGLECVRALRHAGFVVQSQLAGCVTVHNGGVAIEVPLADLLEPTALVTILERAGIPPARFVELLEE